MKYENLSDKLDVELNKYKKLKLCDIIIRFQKYFETPIPPSNVINILEDSEVNIWLTIAITNNIGVYMITFEDKKHNDSIIYYIIKKDEFEKEYAKIIRKEKLQEIFN